MSELTRVSISLEDALLESLADFLWAHRSRG